VRELGKHGAASRRRQQIKPDKHKVDPQYGTATAYTLARLKDRDGRGWPNGVRPGELSRMYC